jgi:chemotaxis protein MotA
MLADGHDEGTLTTRLRNEMDAMDRRHGAVIAAWQGWVDVAPAMGMIGTLVGLVQMLGNMSDPKTIGPAMALALLTTLYGALIANVVAGPITNKLKIYHAEEMIYREAVLTGLQGIARGDNPRMIGDTIVALLPPAAQTKLTKA